MTAEVSHGRGGAGNMAADDTQYVDGEVVRAGPRAPTERAHSALAEEAASAHSPAEPNPHTPTRAGNIADAKSEPAPRADKDVVPEEAYRPSTEGQDYHVGRGGAGNAVETDKPAAHKDIDHEKKAAAQARADGNPGVSVADKLKAKILAPFNKK
ncbi:uncharacterized protein ColSpa_02555 [Colletotrichum spaethianum]|uniref:Uncharacterized protein n=1 Tax=Colletotrichum spaethianum TaxID=700344 RepID=A0AA37L999_9PEZI|nr:uncharacterized protein ColSpa_02555 [Colletotrichum spaethianum]GKT42374.1 hypothetical protein ColSpa_02555 [Colletotrichum spaethianum]